MSMQHNLANAIRNGNSSQPGADKPIDVTYVSQILNGHRAFGEKSAKNMATRAGLPEGYFSKNVEITGEESALLTTIRERGLSPDQVKAALDALFPSAKLPSESTRLSRRKPVDSSMSFDILNKNNDLCKKKPLGQRG